MVESCCRCFDSFVSVRYCEIFCYEVDVFPVNGEFFSTEIIEDPRIGGKVEAQPPGVQRLTLFVIAPVNRFTAVFPVAEQRPARMCHLDTDLMSPSGQKAAFHQGESAPKHQNLVFRDSTAGAGLRLRLDKNLVFDRVLEEFVLQPALVWLGMTANRTKIVLFDLSVAYFFIQDPKRFGILGRNNDTSGVPVNAVAEGGGEGMLFLRMPFAFLSQIGLNVGDQGVVIPFPGAVTEHTGLLVSEKDILILIENAEAWFCDLQPGVVLSRRLKKFVIDIQRQYIPDSQAEVPLGGLSVNLDTLETDILLQKAVRQQGNGFCDKTVKPLSGVVFLCGELFHVYSPFFNQENFCKIRKIFYQNDKPNSNLILLSEDNLSSVNLSKKEINYRKKINPQSEIVSLEQKNFFLTQPKSSTVEVFRTETGQFVNSLDIISKNNLLYDIKTIKIKEFTLNIFVAYKSLIMQSKKKNIFEKNFIKEEEGNDNNKDGNKKIINLIFDLHIDEENQNIIYGLTLNGQIKLYKIKFDDLYQSILSKTKSDDDEEETDNNDEDESESKPKKKKKSEKIEVKEEEIFFMYMMVEVFMDIISKVKIWKCLDY